MPTDLDRTNRHVLSVLLSSIAAGQNNRHPCMGTMGTRVHRSSSRRSTSEKLEKLSQETTLPILVRVFSADFNFTYRPIEQM
jgi:hypothetical protein